MFVKVTKNAFDAFIHSRKMIYQVVHTRIENTNTDITSYIAVDDNSVLATVADNGVFVVREISLTDSESISSMESEMLDSVEGLVLPYRFHIETYMVDPCKVYDKLESLVDRHKDKYVLISILGTKSQAVIRKNKLLNEHILLHTYKNEIGYVIGRGGINLKMTIETIKESFVYSKVKRIAIGATDKDLVSIRKEFLEFVEKL